MQRCRDAGKKECVVEYSRQGTRHYSTSASPSTLNLTSISAQTQTLTPLLTPNLTPVLTPTPEVAALDRGVAVDAQSREKNEDPDATRSAGHVKGAKRSVSIAAAAFLGIGKKSEKKAE